MISRKIIYSHGLLPIMTKDLNNFLTNMDQLRIINNKQFQEKLYTIMVHQESKHKI